MSKNADVIIIGAGVIGTATAFELAKLGYKTITCERNHDAGTGSTGGSCAIIRVHYSTLAGSAFAYEGYFYWRDWADYLEIEDEQGLARFIDCGCLVMATEANGYLEKHKGFCRELGIPFEDWNADQIVEHLPIYSMASFAPPKLMDDPTFGESNGGAVKSGVFFPTAGYVTDPQLSAHNLMRAAEAKGSIFRFNETVTEILREDGRAAGVTLASGDVIRAPVVLNVGGPASGRINAMAGVTGDMTITTHPLRQEVAHVPSPSGFDFEKTGIVVSDGDIGCYIRPEHGNHILIGSEDPPCDKHDWVDDENFNREFTEQWTTQVHRYAQRVPSLGIPSRTRGVVELYDVTEDWIPIYDKSSLPGFYMACGSSGNQYKNAPIAGKMMASLVDYCESGHDHDNDPLQFRMPYIDRDLDVGFYSRKREINKESSFSVLG
ncbi:MAG: NAD(P)/FAD-dependent oxidoreductase [Geminicoccaceae bacterium]